MVKHLLPQRERYFKTALHVHTDVSDGFWTPEQLKARFREDGFSVVAFSDHNLITDQSHLNDQNFLALTAYEMGFREKDVAGYYAKGIHINVLAKEPGHLWQACRPEKLYDNSSKYLDRVEIANVENEFGIDRINDFIARSNEKGFLCTYNHPDSSMFYRGEDMELTGMWGVEVFNNDSRLCGNTGYNDEKYQRFLLQGKRVFPVISDDCHSAKSFRGYGMWVGAKELTYPAVIEALEKGDFYATNGPRIHSLTLEDKLLRITCSEAMHIGLVSHSNLVMAKPPHGIGAPVTEAKFDLTRWFESINDEWKDKAFFRLVLTDAQGMRAYTRPYWYDEL